MHRFLSVLARRAGAKVISVEIGHRPRRFGRSNYGVHDRLWVGIVDLFGVAWLQRRALAPENENQD
jgi:dolichol-phosphate mannosyltransferase